MVKTFEQFLAEGRDAPLYHKSARGANQIVAQDRIEGRTDHQRHSPRGVSLTRSFDTALKWRGDGDGYLGGGEIIFQLDQSKLIHNHKISPINIQYRWKNGDSTSKEEQLFEEFVVGDIYPLSRYLTALWVNYDERVKLLHVNTEYEKGYINDPKIIFSIGVIQQQKVINHPLCRDIKTGKFVNK